VQLQAEVCNHRHTCWCADLKANTAQQLPLLLLLLLLQAAVVLYKLQRLTV
jgi:hypothetical protein